MNVEKKISQTAAVRSKVLAAQPDYLSSPIKTATGPIYFRRLTALALPIPKALMLGYEIAAVTTGQNVRLQSSFAKRLSANEAPATLRNYTSSMVYSVAAMDVVSRLRFLEYLCRFIEFKSDATGFESILATTIESCWAYCNDDLALLAERTWLKYAPYGEIAKRDGIYVLNASTLTIEVYNAQDLKEFDITRKLRMYPNGSQGEYNSAGQIGGGLGWMEGLSGGKQGFEDSLGISGSGDLDSWIGNRGKEGTLDSLGKSGRGGPGSSSNSSPGFGNPGYDPGMPGGNYPGQAGADNKGGNSSPGLGSNTGYDPGMPGYNNPGSYGIGGSSGNSSPRWGIEVEMPGAHRQGNGYLSGAASNRSPDWGGRLGNTGVQFGGPFGRGRSPGEQRMDSHDDVVIGGMIAATGGVFIAAAVGLGVAASGGVVGTAAVVVTIAAGAAITYMGIKHAIEASGKTKDKPTTETNPTSSVSKDNFDVGEDRTEDVAVIEDEEPGDEEGKPDPNDTTGKPNPEDEGGGGPNSRAASFPKAKEFYPNPEDSNPGGPNSILSQLAYKYYPNPEDSNPGSPNSFTAQLVDVPVALGNGLQTSVQQLGDKSFRITM